MLSDMGNGVGTALANRVAPISAAWPMKSGLAKIDAFAPLGLVASGDPYSIDAGRRRMPHRETRAGSRRSVRRRPRRSARISVRRLRSKPRASYSASGYGRGARPVGDRRYRPAGRALGQRTMARRQAGDARLGAVGPCSRRRQGPRTRRRDGRHGPRFQSLGMGARVLHDRR